MFIAAEFGQLRDDVVARNVTGLERLHKIAGLGHRAGAGVDEDAGPSDGRVVGLAYAGPETADEVDMGAGAEPFAVEDECSGCGCAADDVRVGDTGLEIFADLGALTPGSDDLDERPRFCGISTPDLDMVDWPFGGVRLNELRCESGRDR